MTDDRLPTDIWLRAHIRRCNAAGVPATIVHKGEGSRGTVMLKLNHLEGSCRVLTQVRTLDGELAWMAALDGVLAPEREVDAYIARAVSRDPDLWVIEIEHRDGWHPFDGRIL